MISKRGINLMKLVLSFLTALILTLCIPLAAAAETAKKTSDIYPVNVYEAFENGKKQIIKTYELSEKEKPENIPRGSFQRDGWNYELADIIKKETASADVKEHTKTVSLNTETNDINSIVKQLAQTVEYKSNDGYMGILNLDVSSIKVETAGTKNESYTISSVREYPNLSNNDAASIPKTITENGKTLTLAGIEWRTETSSSVDYQELPTTYTAVVNYTATGTNAVITGYSVTAEYKGSISKIKTGSTIYTAVFNGQKIIPVEEKTTIETTSYNTTEEAMKGGDAEMEELSDTFVIFVVLFTVFGGVTGIGLMILLNRSEEKNLSLLKNDEYSEISENDEKEYSEISEYDKRGE